MINENAGLGGWEQIEKEAIPNDFLFQQFSLKLQLHHNEFISLIEYDYKICERSGRRDSVLAY